MQHMLIAFCNKADEDALAANTKLSNDMHGGRIIILDTGQLFHAG